MIENLQGLPVEVKDWIQQHSQDLLLYPNHYLLIALPRGVILAAETQQEWLQKVMEMSRDTSQFSAEELKQPAFMIITSTPDLSKRGQA